MKATNYNPVKLGDFKAHILEPNESVHAAAKAALSEVNHFHDVKVRDLGTTQHEDVVYKVFETYADSGSDDYYYFAAPYYKIEN